MLQFFLGKLAPLAGVADDAIVLTPSASSAVLRPASASSSFVVTPSASAARDLSASASSGFTITPLASGGVARPVAASSSFTVTPSSAGGFHRAVAATSQIILTPAASVDADRIFRLSASSQIILTPAAIQTFVHGILASAESLIILTPHASERVPGPLPVSASSLIVVTPHASSGRDIHVGPGGNALDPLIIVLTPSATQTFEPAPPQARSVSARERIILRPEADAVISRARFGELGRYRRGDKVTLAADTTVVPDSAPIAVVYGPGDAFMGAFELPMDGPTRSRFALPVQVVLDYPFGTYRVSYQFTVGGAAGAIRDSEFQVIPGGDSGGEVISLHAFDRPETRFVLAQLNSGRICVGRNPSLGD